MHEKDRLAFLSDAVLSRPNQSATVFKSLYMQRGCVPIPPNGGRIKNSLLPVSAAISRRLADSRQVF